ncbi:MAG TPA: CehA/McbA family metallohydrolase [Thermogutta sp.]|nr:CehA/McbA family metallohydrolase [Thermogutta sp.]
MEIHRVVASVSVLGLFCLFPAQTALPEDGQPPVAALTITQPKAGGVVSGNVSIVVQVMVPPGAAEPTRMLASLGGVPWVELTKDGDKWQATLNSTLVPNGPQLLKVVTNNRKVQASCTVNVDNPLHCWFADLHSHTSYSDGTYLPSDAHAYARNVAKLDVFSLTDHLESVDANEWQDIRETAWKANELGKFVAIVGLEWTKAWGHLCIYDPPTYRWPTDPQAFYQAAVEANVVLKFNHPGDGTKSHDGLAYSELGDKVVQLMEVRNPVEEQAFQRALRLGWHIAPEGSTDTHGPNWGNTNTWTGILAPGLSVRNILDALANRRCYSTRDRNCRFQFSINGSPMGTIITTPIRTAKLTIQLNDPDDNDVITKVELFQDGEQLEVFEPNQKDVLLEKTYTPSEGKHYIWAKVTQADGNLLWGAPIWFIASGKAE